MSNALLLIGTRKGCFLMESDDDRRKWKLRGPFCEGWPVYHAVYDGSSGAIYAAAASEWLGSTVWRSPDLGETWTQSSEGLSYGEVGFCVHKYGRSSVDGGRMCQRNHVGMHGSDDAAHSGVEITEGLPTDFGFAAAAHPHDRDTFCVSPLDPGHGRNMPDGKAAVWRTRDAGASWQRLYSGLPQENAYVGVLREAMVMDSHDSPGVYFGTSTGQLFASTDEGDSWQEIANYLPPIWSVEVAHIG